MALLIDLSLKGVITPDSLLFLTGVSPSSFPLESLDSSSVSFLINSGDWVLTTMFSWMFSLSTCFLVGVRSPCWNCFAGEEVDRLDGEGDDEGILS